jgi:hypothetical protein
MPGGIIVIRIADLLIKKKQKLKPPLLEAIQAGWRKCRSGAWLLTYVLSRELLTTKISHCHFPGILS